MGQSALLYKAIQKMKIYSGTDDVDSFPGVCAVLTTHEQLSLGHSADISANWAFPPALISIYKKYGGMA